MEHVLDGMVLARNIHSDRADGAPLLRAGTTLTRDLAARVGRVGLWAVWIDDVLGESITPPPEFPADAIAAAVNTMTAVFEAAHRARLAQDAISAPVRNRLRDAAADIADCVLEYPEDACPVTDLLNINPSPQWHAVRVALIGAFLGRSELLASGWTDHTGTRRFDGFDERLTTLATGLLAHDVGIPATVSSFGSPSWGAGGAAAHVVNESEQPAEHVATGAELFPALDTPAGVRSVIQSHHERWDGMGYPHRKMGDAIGANARIAAVADGYDALISRSGGQDPVAVNIAVRAIETAAGSRFDPTLVDHFRRLVMPYPVGHAVTLPDGREAIIAKVDRGTRFQPTVRLRSESGPVVELVTDLSPDSPTTLAA